MTHAVSLVGSLDQACQPVAVLLILALRLPGVPVLENEHVAGPARVAGGRGGVTGGDRGPGAGPGGAVGASRPVRPLAARLGGRGIAAAFPRPGAGGDAGLNALYPCPGARLRPRRRRDGGPRTDGGDLRHMPVEDRPEGRLMLAPAYDLLTQPPVSWSVGYDGALFAEVWVSWSPWFDRDRPEGRASGPVSSVGKPGVGGCASRCTNSGSSHQLPPRRRLAGHQVSSFHLYGGLGYTVAVALAVTAVMGRGRLGEGAVDAGRGGALTFVAVATLTHRARGGANPTYYHHEVTLLTVCAAVAAAQAPRADISGPDRPGPRRFLRLRANRLPPRRPPPRPPGATRHPLRRGARRGRLPWLPGRVAAGARPGPGGDGGPGAGGRGHRPRLDRAARTATAVPWRRLGTAAPSPRRPPAGRAARCPGSRRGCAS